MSVVDRVLAAVTPTENDKARADARARARAVAMPGDWLSQALDHHLEIEAAFETVRTSIHATARIAAQRELTELLTAHSIAEENVIYPALARADEKAHATLAYSEQAAAKLQMGLLEYLTPMSQEYLDKLEQIRSAVAHHVYAEEGKWFLELQRKASAADQVKLGDRYRDVFDRHMDERFLSIEAASRGLPQHSAASVEIIL